MHISLDDDAPSPLTCPLTDDATERPVNPLSAFNGENAMGEWVLTVSEDFVGITLTNWILDLCLIGADCLDIDEITGNIGSGAYRANSELSSSGLIPATNTVYFLAGNQVTLNSGFEVEEEATLEVILEPCNGTKQ